MSKKKKNLNPWSIPGDVIKKMYSKLFEEKDKFKTGGVVPGPIVSVEPPLLPGERIVYRNMKDGSSLDYISLRTGKKYAYSQVIGISMSPKDAVIYSGYDNMVGEFDGGLTVDEKKEIALMAIVKWVKFLEKLNE